MIGKERTGVKIAESAACAQFFLHAIQLTLRFLCVTLEKGRKDIFKKKGINMSNTYIPFDYGKAERTAARTKAFYEEKKSGVQIHIKSCASLNIPAAPPLNSFSFPQDMEHYLDGVFERDYLFARFHEMIEDDFIPSTSPWYGIAEHTAFLGGKVDFTESTTFQHQICENIEEFHDLKLDRNNFWIRLVVDGIAYMREKWGEYIPIRMRGADGPSDIANAIRGNELFYDIYDDPDELYEMMKFCAKATNFTLDLQRQQATKIADGCINGFGIWMPGRCVGHISEDFSTMISREVYEEHFFHALKSCVKGCDMAMLHVHSLGERMIPAFAEVDEIKIMELSSDPNCARAVDVYRKYRDVLNDKVVIVAPTYEELISMEDLFESSRTIIWYYAQDEEDAKRALAAVEKYRR